jgi:GntR family transcriptional regulator/MocR family aminotransferase
MPSNESITAGSDFLQLNIADAPVGAWAEWLAGQVRLAISDGRLAVGSRLPATRLLAAELHVSRGVVTEAYLRLSEDGHVLGKGRGGTVVVAAPLSTRAADPNPVGPLVPAALFRAAPGADIFETLRAVPARVDLSPGLPDLTAFPRAAWLRAERRVLSDLPASALGYGDPAGTLALRFAVAHWLARNRGIRVGPDEVLIVAGVAQGLRLLAHLMHDEGIREVAVEDPGSLGVRHHLWNSRLGTPPVTVDSRGLCVDELRAVGVPAVLLTPAHQFPTGVVLDGDRRRELARWAAGGGLVIEDDYDAEHRYDRPPVPALRSMLAEQVFYLGSVSKLLAPALRVGWVVAPARYRRRLIEAKRDADLGNATLPQLVLAQLLQSGDMERQLRFLRRRHRRRRDAMLDAITAHLPGALVQGAAAGLHLTVMFRDDFNDRELAAASLTCGVKVHPLSWYGQRRLPAGLVMGYAANTPASIGDGVAAVGEALRSARLGAGGARAPLGYGGPG